MESDLHAVYGIDLEQVIDTRTWRWLRVKVHGLMTDPTTRLYRAYMARREGQG